MGRAFPRYYDCKIEEREHVHKGKTYICYSINGSRPRQWHMGF